MSEIKLLPCPCCNGISILDEAGAEIRCIDCGLTMSIANCFSIQGGWKQAVEEAVTKWNTRKPMERIIEKVEKCVEWDGYTLDIKKRVLEICKEEGGIE